MILSIVLVPLLFFILTVVTVGNPAIVPPHNGFVDPMEDEPRVLSPEVVAKVNENWLRDVKASTEKIQTFWGGKGRDKNMSINAEAVEIFLKAQKGGHDKLLKGLVKRHVAECNYSKQPYHSLRKNVEIKLLLKCLKKS